MTKERTSSNMTRSEVRMAAINKRRPQHIEIPTERQDKSVVQWGDRNSYPDYLLDLYNSVATLRSIINGSVDYTVGDDVVSNIARSTFNKEGATAIDIVRQLATSYFMYGGFAIEVIRALDGSVAEIYPLDFRQVRRDKDGEQYFVREDWSERSGKALTYPKFVPTFTNEEASIHYVKNTDTQVYPAPLYAASIKACEVERSIDEFHLNSINNGFMGSYIINFNSGVPSDAEMDEIERNANEKFTGVQNAGRLMLCFNESGETATTVERLEMDDFGDKYTTLAKHCRQQIFTAFRANPNLFGIPTESLGFSSEEYESAFKLYNRTQIRPVQRRIVDALDYIFGVKGCITIKPFSIEDGKTTDTNVQ